MKKSQVDKHPLVRFIRWIRDFFRSLFKSTKSIDRSAVLAHRDIYYRSKIDADKYITVGELFNRVKWQFPDAMETNVESTNKLGNLADDCSRN